MYNMMRALITKRFYETAAQTLERINVFALAGRLSAAERAALSALVERVYNGEPEV